MTTSTGRQLRSAGGVLTIALLFVAALQAHAQTFIVLHRFAGFPNDGRMPTAPLIEDSAGNLYGTTYAAGKYGGGVVFKLNPNGHGTVLHNFSTGAAAAATNGANPAGGLVMDAAGNLYGTTANGGDLQCSLNHPDGCGTVFRLDSTNRLTVLQRFNGGYDGADPTQSLLLDASGRLFGTNELAGPGSDGMLYQIDTATGQLTYIHSFYAYVDGTSNLVEDAQGNLWGTASDGGIYSCWEGYLNCGGIFEFFANSDYHSMGVALEFPLKANGTNPVGGLVMDAAGDFYGTTQHGGNFACPGGCGVVFEFDPAVGETVLYRFTGIADGANPQAGVVRDSAGNLNGTTRYGGMTTTVGGGYGVVFEIDTTGKYTVLHTFNGNDGAQPEANLLLDSAGNLYGTTAYGGSSACTSGCGVVFKITP